MLIAKRFHVGFTLVELMVGIVIVAILMAIGMPAFQNFIQRNQLKTSTDALQNGLQIARAEAVQRNGLVRFVLLNGRGDWSVLDAAGTEIQGRSSRSEGTGDAVVTATLVGGATTAGPATLTYNGLGQVVNNADATASIRSVLVALPAGWAADTRRIDIGMGGSGGSVTGGQVRVCDPAVSSGSNPARCL